MILRPHDDPTPREPDPEGMYLVLDIPGYVGALCQVVWHAYGAPSRVVGVWSDVAKARAYVGRLRA